MYICGEILSVVHGYLWLRGYLWDLFVCGERISVTNICFWCRGTLGEQIPLFIVCLWETYSHDEPLPVVNVHPCHYSFIYISKKVFFSDFRYSVRILSNVYLMGYQQHCD